MKPWRLKCPAYFISGARTRQFDASSDQTPQQRRAMATSSIENSSPSRNFCLANIGASWVSWSRT